MFIYTVYGVIEYLNLQCNEKVKKLLICLVCKSGTKNKIIFAIYILNTILIRNQANRNKSLSLRRGKGHIVFGLPRQGVAGRRPSVKYCWVPRVTRTSTLTHVMQ